MKKLIALALFVFTFGTFSLPVWSADKITLMLDWFVNPDHGPIIIAQENGYFAEQGLEVEIIPPADPSDPPSWSLRVKSIWLFPISPSCICRLMPRYR